MEKTYAKVLENMKFFKKPKTTPVTQKNKKQKIKCNECGKMLHRYGMKRHKKSCGKPQKRNVKPLLYKHECSHCPFITTKSRYLKDHHKRMHGIVDHLLEQLDALGGHAESSGDEIDTADEIVCFGEIRKAVAADTNIYMQFFHIIEDIVYTDDVDLIVPYVVLQELDKIKHSRCVETRKTAQYAHEKLNEYMKEGKVQYKQSLHAFQLSVMCGNLNNDDLMLSYVHSLKKETMLPFLLTDDWNLQNKARASKVQVRTPYEFANDGLLPTTFKF